MIGLSLRQYRADLDLCGRIMLTHRLDAALLVRALGLSRDTAEAVLGGAIPVASADEDQTERLALLANILTRLEIRFAHDSQAVQAALEQPIDHMSGRTIAEQINGDIDTLRNLRIAIDRMHPPMPAKWWRIGH